MNLRKGVTAITLIGGLILAGTSAASAEDGSRAKSTAQQLAVPAYFYPGGDGAALWDQLEEAGDDIGIVVVNPSSGPGSVRDANYAAAMSAADAAGVTVLGYVATGYLGTTGRATRLGETTPGAWFAQVQQDIARWYELYGDDGLGGIFFDEVQNVCGPDGRYADVYRELDETTKRTYREGGVRTPFTVINPGIDTERCYADIGDVILTIEETFDGYAAWEAPAWHRAVDPQRLWHLVHTTGTEQQMVEAMRLAKERNAGYVYVTPDVLANPWDTLPPDSYWDAELAAAAGERADTEPPRDPGRPRAVKRSATEISLVWRPSVDRGSRIAGYDIYLDGARAASTLGRPPIVTLRGLDPATTYEVSVRARDRAGNVSELGGIAGVTTRSSDADPPAAVSGLAAADVRLASALLNWGAAPEPDVVAYDVTVDGRHMFSLPSWLYTGEPVTVPLSALEPGTTYQVTVAARDSSGNVSAAGEPLEFTTLEPSGDPISDAAGAVDGTTVTYQAQYNRPFDFHHVFIDVDSDESTGFATAGVGADFLIENGWMYSHAGAGWSWAPVDVDPLISFENDLYVWQVPVSVLEDGLGAPLDSHRAVFHGSGTSPEAFSDIVTIE